MGQIYNKHAHDYYIGRVLPGLACVSTPVVVKCCSFERMFSLPYDGSRGELSAALHHDMKLRTNVPTCMSIATPTYSMVRSL